jgi:hypothetical protein
MDLDLPQGSLLVADKAYTDYDHQDMVEDVGLASKGPAQEELQAANGRVGGVFVQAAIGQYIETVFSQLTGLFARKIDAVTPRGFELKIVCAILASSIQCL